MKRSKSTQQEETRTKETAISQLMSDTPKLKIIEEMLPENILTAIERINRAVWGIN
jgi:hypothetical protein